MNLYTIYDTIAEEPAPLFESKNHASAQRSALQALARVKDIFLGDYKLLCIGRWEMQSGQLQGILFDTAEEIPLQKPVFENDLEEKQDA